jgi:hypothetical protein
MVQVNMKAIKYILFVLRNKLLPEEVFQSHEMQSNSIFLCVVSLKTS